LIIRFDAKTLSEFNAATKELEKGQVVYLGEDVKDYYKLYPILIFGCVKKMFDFGSESGKGYWIKRSSQIKIKWLLGSEN